MVATVVHLLQNFIAPVFQSTDKSHLFISNRSKLLHLLRYLFFLAIHLFTSLLPFSLSLPTYKTTHHDVIAVDRRRKSSEDSAVGRALHQLLTLVSEIPVSSMKYDVVRSLAEKLIRENLEEDSPALREVNCAALSAAFSRIVARLEAAMLGIGLGLGKNGLGRAVRAVKGWCVGGGGIRGGGVSAEKMAAGVVWLAEKLEENGAVEVAVKKWASASSLGQLALMAEPRVQASLLKVTGGSNGEDAPTLSRSEREEIEKALEVIIERQLDDQDEEIKKRCCPCGFTTLPSALPLIGPIFMLLTSAGILPPATFLLRDYTTEI